MFVLSVEGAAYMDRGLWTTHEILAVGPDRDEVLKAVPPDAGDEEILILTDMATGEVERIPSPASSGDLGT